MSLYKKPLQKLTGDEIRKVSRQYMESILRADQRGETGEAQRLRKDMHKWGDVVADWLDGQTMQTTQKDGKGRAREPQPIPEILDCFPNNRGKK